MKILFLTGMHRSGTSCLAGELANAGLSVSDTLLPANEGNPKGYFEDFRLVSLHDQILHENGSNWMDPAPLKPDWLEKSLAKGFDVKLSDYLGEFKTVEGYFLIKEPRLARLLPLWLHVCKVHGHDAKLLHVWRNPLEVVDSLWRRNNIPFVHGLQLWARYNLDILASSSSIQNARIEISDFVASPGLLKEACMALGISVPQHELLGTFTEAGLLKSARSDLTNWSLSAPLISALEGYSGFFDQSQLEKIYALCGGDMAAAERRHYAYIHSILWTVVEEFNDLKHGVRTLAQKIS